MNYHAAVVREPAAAYEAVWVPRPQIKVDNRAYVVASMGFWLEVTGPGPIPVPDPGVVPVQSALEVAATGYLDLLG
ncbi:MAG: hypothetical protein ABIJ48_05800 [Actinomycetota bacterium]